MADYARVEVGRDGRLTAVPGVASLAKGTRLVVLDLKVSADRVRLFTHTLETLHLPAGRAAYGCTEFVFLFDPGTLYRAEIGTVAGRMDQWLPPIRRADKEDQGMMHMMDGSCGPMMAVIAGLGGLLSLGLVGSLTVLIWVVIGRLRRTAASA